MAAVVKTKAKSRNPPVTEDGEDAEENKFRTRDASLTSPLLHTQDENSERYIDVEKGTNTVHPPNKKPSSQQIDGGLNPEAQLSEDIEDEEVIGIITLEDVFEELLQVTK